MSAVTGIAAVVSHIEDRLGLSFSGPRHDRLMGALRAALSRTGATSADALLAAIEDRDDVYAEVVRGLTVGETSFFRERPQLELLGGHILPAVALRAPGPIQMWSAGCASGEEAYTLAMVAEASGVGDRCRVTGTDLSRHAIDHARAGSYGPWALRSVTDLERARYFSHVGGRAVVDQRFRPRVRFAQHNLLEGAPAPGRFHVIFCRNVLIYLTPAAVRRAATDLSRALSPDGWLVTASGDPPLDVDGLERVRTPYGLAYRRADRSTPPTLPVVTSPPRSTRSSAPHAASGPAPSERWRIPSLAHSEVRHDEVRPDVAHDATAADGPPSIADRMRSIRALADAGRVNDAVAAATAAVDAEPLDASLRYLTAVVLLEAGEPDLAAAAASAAVYLAPDLAVGHLLLGNLEHARGNSRRAQRGFRDAARLLSALPGDAEVELADGISAAHLAAFAVRSLTGEPAR